MSGKQSAPSNGDAAARIGIRDDELARALVDCLPDSLFAKDATGRFLWANQSAAALRGADSPVALVGKTDFDFYSHEKASQIR